MSEATVDERRSPRVLLRIAVRLAQEGLSRDAETAVVNRHGALLLVREACAEGVTLELTNLESGRSASFRVVWSGGEGPRGLSKLGVTLLEPIEDFWGPDYDRLAANAATTAF